jgi:hypothetical protein
MFLPEEREEQNLRRKIRKYRQKKFVTSWGRGWKGGGKGGKEMVRGRRARGGEKDIEGTHGEKYVN